MGPGKTFQQERATLRAHHQALEVDLLGHGAGIDLLDYYRGTLSWRRLAIFIRHFQSTPGSALFESIEREAAPKIDVSDLPDLDQWQSMQLLRWTSLDEGLRHIVLAIYAAAGVNPELPRPWEVSAVDSDAARNRARSDAYMSPEAVAARSVVAPVVLPEPREG